MQLFLKKICLSSISAFVLDHFHYVSTHAAHGHSPAKGPSNQSRATQKFIYFGRDHFIHP